MGSLSSRNHDFSSKSAGIPQAVWKRVACLLLAAALLLLVPTPAAGARSLEDMALAWINEDRLEEDLPPLKLDERLQAVARRHAEEMVKLGYFSHISPVTGTPSSRLRSQSIAFLRMGENVGRHSSLEVIHKALMNSPSHRGNMLHPAYEAAGIGIVRQPDGRLLMVQVFLQAPRTYVAAGE